MINSADEKTPVDTPDAKRKSGQYALTIGNVPCPRCQQRGFLFEDVDGAEGIKTTCTLCKGLKFAPVDEAIQWTTEHGE